MRGLHAPRRGTRPGGVDDLCIMRRFLRIRNRCGSRGLRHRAMRRGCRQDRCGEGDGMTEEVDPEPAPVPDGGHHGDRGGRVPPSPPRLSSLPGSPARAPARWAPRRSRHQQARAGRDDDGAVAQAAGLDRPSHQGNARLACRANDPKLKDPESDRLGSAPVRQQRGARPQARVPRAARHLHAPGLSAEDALRRSASARAGRIGPVASSASATARVSTWPGACSRARRLPPICACRRTTSSSDSNILGRRRRGAETQGAA